MTLKEQIRAHALKDAPKEACGFVVEISGSVCAWEVPNISEMPEHFFAIDPAKYLEARSKGKLLAYYHSHPSGSVVSEADKSVSERLALPLYTYRIPQDDLQLYTPNGYAVPLEGRTFVPFVHDCVNLVIDYYRTVLKIHLADFPRTMSDLSNGYANLGQLMQKSRFHLVVDSPRQHDILLMRLGSCEFCNHAGVLIDGQTMLHQLMNRVSERTVYGGYWRRNTDSIWRHQSLL